MALRLRVPRWHEMDKRETPLAQLAEDFLLAKRSAGCSDKTGSWYRENVRGFLRFLEAEGTPPILKSFSVETVRRYTVHLQERRLKYAGNRLRRAVGEGLSTHTIFGYVATLGVFASWLAQEGYTDGNALEGMPRPKKRRTVISALSQQEMERLLARIPRHTVLGVRDRAMVITLLDTGLRASELCNLRLEDVHLQDGYLKVLGKGDRERIVPVGANAARALMRYIQFFRREPARPGLTNVFLSVHGEEMTPGALRLLVQRWGRSAAIQGINVHKLRHTFALQYLMAGGDAFSLQKILGHTSMEMTRNYVNMLADHLVEKHRLHSPMDRIRLSPSSPDPAGRKDGRDPYGRFAPRRPPVARRDRKGGSVGPRGALGRALAGRRHIGAGR